MQKTDTQLDAGQATLGDSAGKLGLAVVATAEYQSFNVAERRYRNDLPARELLAQYQEEQRTTQLMQQLGKTTPEDTQRLEGLQKNIETNQTLMAYFDAQEKLVALLTELNEFVSGELNLDFAGLTKPKSGCCG